MIGAAPFAYHIYGIGEYAVVTLSGGVREVRDFLMSGLAG